MAPPPSPLPMAGKLARSSIAMACAPRVTTSPKMTSSSWPPRPAYWKFRRKTYCARVVCSRAELWDVLRDLVRDGTTLLLTTQYLEEADQLADQIVVVDHGRVIAAGTPLELKDQSGRAALVLTVSRAEDLDRAIELLERHVADI